MNLFRKTMLTLFMVFMALFLVLYLSIQYIVHSGFEALEKSNILQNTGLLRHSLFNTLTHLRVLVVDWATWNETYQFIQDANPRYVKSNIENTTFENAGLNAILYLNGTGHVVFAMGYDLEADHQIPVSPALTSFIVDRLKNRTGASAGQTEAGLMSVDGCFYLMASAPILPGNGKGEPRGNLVFISPFESSFQKDLSTLPFSRTRVIPLAQKGSLNGPLDKAVEIFRDVYIQNDKASLMTCYVLLRDLDGRPAMALALDIQRNMKHYQDMVLFAVTATLMGLGLVFILVSLVSVRKVIVDRLTRLNEAVLNITQKGTLSTGRVLIKGRDELSELGNSFNSMLEALSDSQFKLKEHDAYLKTLFDSLHVGLLVIDGQTHRILDVNEYALNLIGGNRAEVFSSICQQFVCPTDPGKCPVGDLHQKVELAEAMLMRKGRPSIPILKSVVPVVRNGRTLHIESFIDISHLKAVENALRSRLEIESVIAAIASDFVRMHSARLDEAIQLALKRIGEITGVDRSYIFIFSPDKGFMSNTHEWCREGIRSVLDELQLVPTATFPWWIEQIRHMKPVHVADLDNMPQAYEYEKEFLKGQGIQSFLAVPIQSEGSLMGFLGFDMVREKKTWLEEDISLLNMMAGILSNALRRREIDQDLMMSAERYQAIFDNSGAGSLLVDASGKIMLVNQEFLNMTGLPESELVGISWTDLIDQSDVDKASKDWQSLIFSNQAARFLTLRLKTRRYEAIYVRTALTRMPASEEIIISFTDITDRKNAEMALQKAARMKSEFLANVSHEIRSPLNSIIGYAELIREADTVDQATAYARTILSESEDLLALINDVLDNTKLDSG
ncbi:MAG: CHASE4 domain-containing protein, partial [Lentisphaerota bacterium]